MKISGRQRKGISPIVATVLIIAATLIAFAAVLGYIFGIFGGAASTTNGTATVTASVHGAGATATLTQVKQTGANHGNITITLSNSGTGSSTISSYSLTYGGNTETGTIAATFTLNPSGQTGSGASANPLVVYLDVGKATTAGEAFSGSITLANSEVISFTGTYS